MSIERIVIRRHKTKIKTTKGRQKMKKTLANYKEIIKALPNKKKYTKEDLLIPQLLIEEEDQIKIYYAPHNDYINPKAKIFIIGITPGFEQMSTAMVTAKEGLEKGEPLDVIQHKCKVAARFSGTLRKNMIAMLDEIGLNDRLGLTSCSQILEERDDLLHTVSVIPYPVFVKNQNYTGHTPKLVKNQFLMKYVRENFIQEIECLEHKDEMILIPLGRAVEEVLEQLQVEGALGELNILKGFPHPSGANVNRLKQLEANKEAMQALLEQYIE